MNSITGSLLAVLLGLAIDGHSATFDARAEFGSTMGGTTGVWRYQQFDGAKYSDLRFQPGGNHFSVNQPAWVAADAGLPILFQDPTIPDGLVFHPGEPSLGPSLSRHDVVLSWIAPASGLFRVAGFIRRDVSRDALEGNGFELGVFQGDEALLVLDIANNDTTNHTVSIPGMQISAGERVNFRVSDRGDNLYDFGIFNFVVTLDSSAASAQYAPSSDDLWDVSRGVVITGHSSPLACTATDAFDARNLFGGNFAHGCPFELADRFLFADRMPEGFVHYVQWATPNPVTVRSFNLWAHHDGLPSWNRAMASFRLLAKSPGSTTYDLVLHSFVPSLPYTYVDGIGSLVISTDIKPTTVREFRAEFIGFAPVPEDPSNGPRLIELDGFDHAIGPRVAIRTSEVEVSWTSVAGLSYQVEYRDDVPGSNWTTLGSPVVGDGGVMRLVDKVAAGAPRRFYRVRLME